MRVVECDYWCVTDETIACSMMIIMIVIDHGECNDWLIDDNNDDVNANEDEYGDDNYDNDDDKDCKNLII